jgi:hypothetical protein
MVPVGDVYDIVLDLPAYASLAAILSLALLLTLYTSQRRDLRRLLAWMEQDPGHPASDLAASEALLDRAEAELEAIEEVEPAQPQRPATGERPALERVTMEREALQPHPRWRRLARRVGQPRVLGVAGVLAVNYGLVAIFGSEQLLTGEHSGHGTQHGAVVPQDVSVAVLNGTSVPGLAAKVGDDVQANDFKLAAVGNSRRQFDQTVVMYQRGQQRAAKKVAHVLGVAPVQKIDRQTQQASDNADVVVIAGADRAKP